MKIAVTGKGGVGKTTISALLALELAAQGRKVFAIDADPDANLASVLGIPDADSIRPLVDMKALIKERVGATSEDIGSYFTMNPRVDDIPEQYGVRMGNIRLLVLGHIPKARGGCACPENIFLREMVNHALTQQEEVVILDMEAGVEHLGRGTAGGVDVMLIVVEHSRQSIETAHRIYKLARELGIVHVLAVVNKLTHSSELTSIENALAGIPVIAALQDDRTIREESLQGFGVQYTSDTKAKIKDLLTIIENRQSTKPSCP
ncbi:MAG: AAA family ATPase [bacterium]|nr:AAA family ATPase [bacterium]